jgi:hypothetical protein
VENPVAFPEWIQQQEQHHGSANDTKPVAHADLGIDQIEVPDEPAERNQENKGGIAIEGSASFGAKCEFSAIAAHSDRCRLPDYRFVHLLFVLIIVVCP